MNPNLVDSSIFEYDLKRLSKLKFNNTSRVINISLTLLLIMLIATVIYFCKNSLVKKERDKKVKEKLQYILTKSDNLIQYNNY
tara:strand:- start:371 stop:619 length:249 start_codon:yes stop_codon:yes gene_type:complete